LEEKEKEMKERKNFLYTDIAVVDDKKKNRRKQ
jgi:hypothetical protein